MKCKKITGNVLDILDNDDECSRFLKKWIHNRKYQDYIAHEHRRVEDLLQRQAFNCSDSVPPELEIKIKEKIVRRLNHD